VEKDRRVRAKGVADLLQIRHSGERRNPGISTRWTPAFAGVTNISAFPWWLSARHFTGTPKRLSPRLPDNQIGTLQFGHEQTSVGAIRWTASSAILPGSLCPDDWPLIRISKQYNFHTIQ